MICPLQQAFPQVNKNVVESYTNMHNTKYSLVEDFTPNVYDKSDDTVFNSVEGNSAVINNYSNATPSTDYYTYINYGKTGEDEPPKKCLSCPKCKELIQIETAKDNSGLIKDQNDILLLAGLTAFFYYILN